MGLANSILLCASSLTAAHLICLIAAVQMVVVSSIQLIALKNVLQTAMSALMVVACKMLRTAVQPRIAPLRSLTVARMVLARNTPREPTILPLAVPLSFALATKCSVRMVHVLLRRISVLLACLVQLLKFFVLEIGNVMMPLSVKHSPRCAHRHPQ